MNSRKSTLVNPLKAVSILILLVPTVILLYSFVNGQGKDGLKIGKKMPLPDLEMVGTDGTNHTLTSLKKEKGLVVIFSCNTCPFVIGNEDFSGWEVQYNDLHATATANDMGLVLINSNEAKRDGDDSLDKMKLRARDKGYSMPYLVDKNSELADAFGAKTTPHVFVFDKEDKLIYKGSIDNSYDPKAEQVHYLNEVFESVSSGSKIKENSSPPRGCSIKRQ